MAKNEIVGWCAWDNGNSYSRLPEGGSYHRAFDNGQSYRTAFDDVYSYHLTWRMWSPMVAFSTTWGPTAALSTTVCFIADGAIIRDSRNINHHYGNKRWVQ